MSSAGNRFDSADKAQGILLVDDDERVLKFVAKMLYSFGYDEVYQASSVPQAMDLWKQKQNKIWLLVSDFVMPKMTGDMLALELQKDRADLKVLFISGNDPASLDTKITFRPGRNFLQKPFTLLELRQTIWGLGMLLEPSN